MQNQIQFCTELVEMSSKEEIQALVEEAEKKGFSDRCFWMGLTDRASERDWRLESNGLTLSCTNWGPSEPNSFGGINVIEECAQMNFYLANTGKWIDINCEKTKKI